MKSLHLKFLPALAFGPLFIVIGLVFTNSGTTVAAFQSILKFSFALGGPLMTCFALSILFWEVVRLRQILDAKADDVPAEQYSVSAGPKV